MDTYPIADLIPGYLNNGTQGDKDFLDFHRWTYDLEYRYIDISEDVVDVMIQSDKYSSEERVIYILKTLYDIDILEEDVVSKGLIDLDVTTNEVIRDREDVLNLINYDRNILRRIACIYNIRFVTLISRIFSKEEFRYYSPFFAYNYNTEHMDDIIYDNYNTEHMDDRDIYDRINIGVIPSYVTSLKIEVNLPLSLISSNVKELIITSDIHDVIPTTVTSINVSFLEYLTLHDNIQYITCNYLLKSQVLPKNLIYLKCDNIPREYILPRTLKALYTDGGIIDVQDIPGGIEYLHCFNIKFNPIYVNAFEQCKYLCVTSLTNSNILTRKVYSLFPNVEALYIKAIIDEVDNIHRMNKLKVLSGYKCNNVRLPEGLLYLNVKIINDFDLSNVRVLNSNTILKKHGNLTTIITDDIKQDQIPDDLVLLHTKSKELVTKDSVIYTIDDKVKLWYE